MTPLDLVRLTPLIDRTSGRSDVTIGLIDGPVAMNDPELASQHIHEIPKEKKGSEKKGSDPYIDRHLDARCASVC
jgi:hypothetical protein